MPYIQIYYALCHKLLFENLQFFLLSPPLLWTAINTSVYWQCLSLTASRVTVLFQFDLSFSNPGFLFVPML